MSSTPTFTRELARLVWLAVYRPSHIGEQKRALRALLQESGGETQRVDHSEVAMRVAAMVHLKPLPEELPWLSELSTRMASHSVRSIEAHDGAKAAELLGLGRALATQSGRDDHGAGFDQQIVALSPTTIAVHLGRDGFVRTPTPPHGMLAVGIRRARTPTAGTTSVAEAVAEMGTRASALATAPLSATEKARIMEAGFMPTAVTDDVVIRLRGDLTVDSASELLDELSRLVEDASRHGAWLVVLDLATKVIEREAAIEQPDVKRAFAILLKRLSKPGILRGVAQLLPKHRELRDQVQGFALRVGDAAADVLIELMVAAESSSDRRAYRDAVAGCPGAVEPLTQLLSDHRWFVVRNAAELLGEMQAMDADQGLINALRHEDARVRHAATLALIKLGTPRAVHTIIRALGDGDASVRLKAAFGLGKIQNPRVAPVLLTALDEEKDERVQLAILSALGHHPLSEVVARLKDESRAGPILRRRPIPRRLVAIQALGDAHTDDASRALLALEGDRDRSVRELVSRLFRARAEPAAVS